VKDLTRIFTAKVCNKQMLLMMKSKNVHSKIFASTNNFIKAYITFIREFNMLINSTMITNVLLLIIPGVFFYRMCCFISEFCVEFLCECSCVCCVLQFRKVEKCVYSTYVNY